jgi:hypothetical protein
LIPGCILTAIAAFLFLKGSIENFNGVNILFLLGLAFYAMFFIHNFHRKTQRWGEKFWPIFPGSILIIINGMVTAAYHGYVTFSPFYLCFISPAALIAAGLFLLIYDYKPPRKS